MRIYKNIQLENGRIVVKANYEKMPIEKFNGNPLIETLPSPFLSDKEIIRKISFYPAFDETAKSNSKEVKKYLLDEVNFYFQALPIHVDLFKKINRVILNGYSTRNPMLPEYKINSILNNTQNNVHFYSTLLISGLSGAGKTVSLKRILKSHYPQIIIHNEFDGKDYFQTQITYLVLEAPYNASLKALTLNFFKKVDEMIGTKRFSKYTARQLSVDMMLPLMADLAKQINLGILVIDELQFMSNSIPKLIDYLTSLINLLGIPVVLIGTPKIYDYLTKEMRLARRITSEKHVIFKGIHDSEEFNLFLNGLFKFQYTSNEIELTHNIVRRFHEVTQGIPDFCVKLFIRIQKYMIDEGKDFDVNIIDFIFNEEFKLVKEMIDALKSNNPHKIALYEDLNLSYFVNNEKVIKNHNLQISGKKNTVHKASSKNSNKKSINKLSLKEFEDGDLRLIKKLKDNKRIYTELKDNNLIFELGGVVK